MPDNHSSFFAEYICRLRNEFLSAEADLKTIFFKDYAT